MKTSRESRSWRLPPTPICAGCGHYTWAKVGTYRDMSARLCATCNREVLHLMFNVPSPIEPEISALVEAIRMEAA
jgi:hypothetical protein